MRSDKILAFVLIIICLVAALGNWLGGNTPRDEMASDRSTAATGANVALLEIYGTISDQPTRFFGTSGNSNSNALIKSIRQARKDSVKAILLHINSPGGTAAASQAVYNELMRVRKETDIKIVADMGDVTASGGYYIASAAHHIVANPATITGSIGVIVQTQNFSPLLDKVGVEFNNVKSGQYKDILSPFRDTSDTERTIIQQIVTQSYQQFLNAIVAGRGITLANLKPLADGRIFTGEQAQRLKLVDSLGNYHDALMKTAELANIQGEPSVRNYSYGSWQNPFDIFLSSSIERFIPGYQQFQQVSWDKIPLALWQ
ncbi:MAG: signal peptide peptidase SppA [Scytonema sp. PMC 1069.18]|nr:signal peptide peptidase SppA [Scytonema sp. PMC 1069.18]MEC4885553.1 signal peptide peptidase SppA [Scytonema sp. PMC 1070.18]